MDPKELLETLTSECKHSGKLRDALAEIVFRCKEVYNEELYRTVDYPSFVKEIRDIAANAMHRPEGQK